MFTTGYQAFRAPKEGNAIDIIRILLVFYIIGDSGDIFYILP